MLPKVAGAERRRYWPGPCGLVFCHALRNRGVAWVSAIDPVERSKTAIAYGADKFFATTSHSWLSALGTSVRPDIVVEAVGHQQETIVDAIRAAAEHGFVYGFGGVEDDHYAIPYRQIYDKALTFAAGRTIDNWRSVLHAGAAYFAEHRSDFGDYVSHIIPVADAQKGYELYASPRVDRLKVAIVNSD